MFGIAGAHRSGKSTIAKMFSERQGIPLVQLPSSRELGFDPKEITNLEQRMIVQWTLLHKGIELYEAQGAKGEPFFITDRTPLDMAAYALADVRQQMTPAEAKVVNSYVTACFNVTNRFFSQILYFAPGIPYKDEPGKPYPNLAYQELVGTLISGLLADSRQNVSYQALGRGVTDLEQRYHIACGVKQTIAAQFAGAVRGMTQQ